MKKLLCFLAATALLCGCGKPAAPPPAPAIHWEYKTVEVENSQHGYLLRSKTKVASDEWIEAFRSEKSDPGDFWRLENELDKIGSDGWEIVACMPELESLPQAEFFDGQDYHETEPHFTPRYKPFVNIRTGKILLIFKRQKS
jgi:hypothetical protein